MYFYLWLTECLMAPGLTRYLLGTQRPKPNLSFYGLNQNKGPQSVGTEESTIQLRVYNCRCHQAVPDRMAGFIIPPFFLLESDTFF